MHGMALLAWYGLPCFSRHHLSLFPLSPITLHYYLIIILFSIYYLAEGKVTSPSTSCYNLMPGKDLANTRDRYCPRLRYDRISVIRLRKQSRQCLRPQALRMKSKSIAHVLITCLSELQRLRLAGKVPHSTAWGHDF